MNRPDVFEVARNGDVVHVRVTGDIDIGNRDELLVRILREASATRRLVLDLTDVGFIDSAGIRFVFDASRELERRGVDLALVRPVFRYSARILALAAIDQTVPLFDAAHEALEAD